MKGYIRKVAMLVICIMLIMTTSIFAQNAAKGQAGLAGLAVKADGTPYLLGMISNEMRSGWVSSFIGYTESLWEHAGGKFKFFVSEYDMNVELSQMNDLQELNPAAILLHASDSHAIAPGVAKAREAGFPVFALDVGVIGTAVDGFVHINQLDLGKKDAAYVAKTFSASNPAVILELTGGLEQDIAIQRRDGFDNNLKNVPYAKIVQTIDTKWSSDNALKAVMDALERNPNINCIYGHSDFFVQGILQGLKLKNKLIPAGQKGHIVLCSIDGDPTGLKGVRDGYIDCIAEHSPILHAAILFNMIVAKLHGYPFPAEVVIDPPLVTKDNVGSQERWGNLPIGKFDQWPVLNQTGFKLPAELVK